MSVTLNPAGDWIAFGCEHLGQLLVWEWQSETYVLKQQGHFNSMACVAYSTDGGTIATGKLLDQVFTVLEMYVDNVMLDWLNGEHAWYI